MSPESSIYQLLSQIYYGPNSGNALGIVAALSKVLERIDFYSDAVEVFTVDQKIVEQNIVRLKAEKNQMLETFEDWERLPGQTHSTSIPIYFNYRTGQILDNPVQPFEETSIVIHEKDGSVELKRTSHPNVVRAIRQYEEERLKEAALEAQRTLAHNEQLISLTRLQKFKAILGLRKKDSAFRLNLKNALIWTVLVSMLAGVGFIAADTFYPGKPVNLIQNPRTPEEFRTGITNALNFLEPFTSHFDNISRFQDSLVAISTEKPWIYFLSRERNQNINQTVAYLETLAQNPYIPTDQADRLVDLSFKWYYNVSNYAIQNPKLSLGKIHEVLRRAQALTGIEREWLMETLADNPNLDESTIGALWYDPASLRENSFVRFNLHSSNHLPADLLNAQNYDLKNLPEGNPRDDLWLITMDINMPYAKFVQYLIWGVNNLGNGGPIVSVNSLFVKNNPIGTFLVGSVRASSEESRKNTDMLYRLLSDEDELREWLKQDHQSPLGIPTGNIEEDINYLIKTVKGDLAPKPGPMKLKVSVIGNNVPVTSAQIFDSFKPLVNKKGEPVGGIDFNSANLNLRIKRDGNGALLPFAKQDMAQLNNLAGLNPVILKIQPAVESYSLTQILTTQSK